MKKDKKLILILPLVLSLFMISSCEKIVTNVDLPDYQSKLVVQCFISPEYDTIRVHVSESVPLFATSSLFDDNHIANATVVLSLEGQGIAIPYYPDIRLYELPASAFPILPGKTYQLRVKSLDGREVTASTTVPIHKNEDIWIVGTSQPSAYEDMVLTFQFKDTPGPGHFYRIAGFTNFEDTMYGGGYGYEIWFDRGERLVSDLNKDGQTFNYRTYIGAYAKVTTRLLLMTVNEEYYRYHKTAFNYIGDDPFSEPVIIYSNISGGLGVFCAYRTHEISITLGK